MKQVSVVIPSYNGSSLLKKNLPAIFAACRSNDQVLIVEDAGTDDTVQFLLDNYELKKGNPHQLVVPVGYYPQPKKIEYEWYENTITVSGKQIQLTLVYVQNNLRFAGAANLGVLYAVNEFIFLCNNDVIPEPDCFPYLLRHFDTADTFAVGCLEYEDSVMGQQSGKNSLFFKRGLFQHSRAADFSTGDTAWASGGSALFDRNKWMVLNGFHTAYYPAYWEDIDLSFRARKLGWKILFEKNAVVYHKHESTHTDVFGLQKIAAMSWKNAQTFTWKNGNFWQRCAYVVWWPYWQYKMFQNKSTPVAG